MKPKHLLKTVIIGGALFTAAGANAQISGADVFLKGHYVEVGIGHLGYYGSDAASPAGYHPHCQYCTTPNGIGFVADPLMTGWDTASAGPHYMGDYFLPGSPFEGWDMQIGSSRFRGYNVGNPSAAIYPSGYTGVAATGSNTGYSASGTTVSGTWQGVMDSIAVTQVTTLDTNAMFFTVQVTLTNMSTSPVDDIYYLRSVDPDNDETWIGGAGFTTDNVINHQMPDSFNVSMVTGSGTSSTHPPLTLGTTDINSRAVIYNAWPIDSTIDLATVYGETSSGCYFDEGTDHPGDIAIGLIMNIAHLATVDSAGYNVLRTTAAGALHPANSATFTYFYAFSPSGVDSAISAGSHPASSLGVNNVTTTAVNVYPNPSKDMINVTGLNTTDRVTLYDMMGRATNVNWPVTAQGTNTFRYSGIANGAYILVVTDANGAVKARVPVRKM